MYKASLHLITDSEYTSVGQNPPRTKTPWTKAPPGQNPHRIKAPKDKIPIIYKRDINSINFHIFNIVFLFTLFHEQVSTKLKRFHCT